MKQYVRSIRIDKITFNYDDGSIKTSFEKQNVKDLAALRELRKSLIKKHGCSSIYFRTREIDLFPKLKVKESYETDTLHGEVFINANTPCYC